MTRLFLIPALLAAAMVTWSCALIGRTSAIPDAPAKTVETAGPPKPFVAQVVGVQWLNPLQRRDYPTEWQLLWTLGLAQPNKNDDMVRTDPASFATLKPVSPIAAGNEGRETFEGYHEKYIRELIPMYLNRYAEDPTYFYTIAPDDRKLWREFAGLHIEYAIPAGRLVPADAGRFVRDLMVNAFDIGSPGAESVWSRATPPDVRVTAGGPNAGFTSLAAALDYLQKHPQESVWAMNWDAPSFPPKDMQLNENITLLVLAGPEMKTERVPLAWVGYPASKAVAEFEPKPGSSRNVQAWAATLDAAARNVGKLPRDIGYTIHDAARGSEAASSRIAGLAQMLTTELPEVDFMKQSFNTPALLGEMGAGTALTNVALGIAYANHLGQHVLVAGTTDAEHPTALVVVPPAKPRPIDPEKPWYRARGGGNAYLHWWGQRLDAPRYVQGYSK